MKVPMYATIVYAALLIIGGLIGFLIAGSEVSLWMGGTLGLVLLIASYTIKQGSHIGLYTALVISLALAFFFGYRYSISNKIFPSGVMMLCSIVLLGINFVTIKFNEK